MYDEFKKPGGTCMLNLHIFFWIKETMWKDRPLKSITFATSFTF